MPNPGVGPKSPKLDRAAILGDASLRGRAFTVAYTRLIDEWIVELFAAAFGDQAGVTLLALGGQGRGEMAPESDLDLLLLHNGSLSAEDAQTLWYPMWDAGLKVGHASRTRAETLDLARDDLATATALLTTRVLCGDREAGERLAADALAQWRKNAKSNLGQLLDTVESRHAVSGEVAAGLEPDLKEGRGGIRDVHALAWMIAADPELDIIGPEALAEQYDALLDARVELHRLAGRARDVVRLQDQDDLADRLGDVGAEHLMTRLTTAARTIAWAADEACFEVRDRLAGGFFRRQPRPRELGDGIELVSGRARLAPGATVDALTPLRVAVAAATHRARIDRSTLERMRTAPLLSDPWPDEARRLFIELLSTGSDAIAVIETLDLADLWVALIPEWEPNRSRPQRNAYHRFTVDRHLWECAAEAAELTGEVDRPDLLLLAALLHDVGKGYPGDHSIIGRELAEVIVRRMGYSAEDVDTLGSLVQFHLLLPDVATRRDLDDPTTIVSIATQVETSDRVRLLGALTEADSLATGPTAWSPWKAGLIKTLIERVAFVTDGGDVERVVAPSVRTDHQLDLLERGLNLGRPVVDVHDDRVTVVCADRPGTFCRVAGVLALNGLDVLEALVHSVDGQAVEEFKVQATFSSEIPWPKIERELERALLGRLALEPRLAERARTYRTRSGSVQVLEPHVRVLDNEASDGATVVEVVGPDRVGLLYELTRALVDLDLDILRAKVSTIGPDVVDSFYVRDRTGRPLDGETDAAEIRSALLYVLNRPNP